MYRVIQDFADAQDKGHLYRAGDVFPRDGAETSQGRIAELSGNGNKQGRPLIELAEDTPDPEKPRRGRRKVAESEE